MDAKTGARLAGRYGWVLALVAAALAWWLAPTTVPAGYVVAGAGFVFCVSMLVAGVRRRS